MQTFKRKRRTRRDMFVLGGWLFADLLLGLAMLFAVANTVGQAPPTPTPTSTPDQLATAQAGFNIAQADNQQTVTALEDQVALADTSADQTAAAADRQSASATEEANRQATRSAMTEKQRATTDAQATENAVVAEGTIAALSTQQAESNANNSQLDRDLATNVARATESAQQVRDLGTQQAELEASATRNASSGANSQATVTAAQSQVSASQTEVANAQATTAASGQQIENANATSAAAQQQVELNSLNPISVTVTFQVDLNGVLARDSGAIEDARASMETVLQPYLGGTNCRVGFVIVSSRSDDLGQGVELSRAMSDLLESEFPQLLPEPADGSAPQLASEAIALPGTQPVGEVQFRLFLSSGCQPAG